MLCLEDVKFNHEEMIRAYEQLSYITDTIKLLYDYLVAGCISSLDLSILKLMTTYEKVGKATKYF